MKRLIALSFILILLSSCSKDDPVGPVVPEVVTVARKAFVLNNGNWGGNDASLAAIDMSAKTVTADVFKSKNGKALGDLGQDIFIFGSKAYIAMSGSCVIYAVDKNTCELKATIVKTLDGGEQLSPRQFTSWGPDLFVTYYEGYVGRIDTTDFTVKNLVKVGNNPEGIGASEGRIFVANSGGMNYPDYDNTVSVIDYLSMAVVTTVEVVDNPNSIVVDDEGEVYVLSYGNFDDVSAAIVRINPETCEVKPVKGVENPLAMAMSSGGAMAILLSKYEGNPASAIIRYDTNKDSEVVIGQFNIDGAVIENPVTLSADRVSGHVFVGCTDYMTTGKVVVFNYDGSTFGYFSSEGLNPWKVALITETYVIE